MINWSNVHKLEADEFTEDPNKYAEPVLIYSLGDIRRFTDEKMRPSPVEGALARFDGNDTSQHFVGPEENPIKKSKASDVFCEGIPFSNYNIILTSGFFNGIGMYLDTTGPDGLPWVMFHLDIRSYGFTQNSPLIWIVEKVYDAEKDKKINKYRYPQAEPKYWKLFNDERLFQNKQFNIEGS